MRVVLLGAGASAGALGSASPVAAAFGASLTRAHADWGREFPFLQSAIQYLRRQNANVDPVSWGLDEVWNGIDENFKLSLLIANDNISWPAVTGSGRAYEIYGDRTWSAFWILAGWEIRRLVAMVYGSDLTAAIAAAAESGGRLAEMLGALESTDIVVTTNYDLLADTLLNSRWPSSRNTIDVAERQSRGMASGPLLLKLHGSVDWEFVSHRCGLGHTICRSQDGGPLPVGSIDFDANGCEHRPLIVPPVSFKDELLVPGTQPPAVAQVLALQWCEAVRALEMTDHLVVVGYRFPAEDAYSLRILRDALSRRVGVALPTDLHLLHDSDDVAERLSAMLPTGSCVRSLGPI